MRLKLMPFVTVPHFLAPVHNLGCYHDTTLDRVSSKAVELCVVMIECPGTRLLPLLVLTGVAGAAHGANIALWSQTSPEYARTRAGAQGRQGWSVWPPEVARNLRYHATYECPPDVRPLLERVLRHACDVWESAADLKFVPVDDPMSARLLVFLKHDGRSGAVYHGAGSSNPPRRDATGALLPTEVHIRYTGDHNGAPNGRADCWVWVAVHELGHALGLWHEFQRPDRDRHLRVDPDDRPLPPLPGECGDTAGTAFDFASVMMYAWTDADRDGRFFLVGGETGEPLPTVNYYQRNGLSRGDVEAIQRMYGRPRGGLEPIVHVPPAQIDAPLKQLRDGGWRIIAHPGARIYGVGEAIVFEAEKGLWDHWTQGGSPPRAKHATDGGEFRFSVDVDARYVPPGSFAGLFIVLGADDWISFGACEDPRQLTVQRTGQNASPSQRVDSQRYRLSAEYREGSLSLACDVRGRHERVARLNSIPPPTDVAFGTRSWPGAEFSYRCACFSNVLFRPVPRAP